MKSYAAARIGILGITLAYSAQSQQPLVLSIQQSSRQAELRWHTPSDSVNSRLPSYQIEASDNLVQWVPLGAPIHAVSPDELHLRSFAADRARAFYRLLASYESARNALLGGGAEVFGYGAALASELLKVGQITPVQFASLYPAPTDYLEQVTFDVTTARFFDEFNADPAVVNLTRVPPFENPRHTDFRLNAEELMLFKKNGFVVSERLSMPSFADQFYRVWKDDLPVYISTDALLQAWHRTYDAMLEELEETFLYATLGRILDGMAARIPDIAAQAGPALKDSLLDADYMLDVARSLLKGVPAPSGLGQDTRVSTTLKRIQAEQPQLDTCFDLFGAPRAVDFSQFKIRGHYQNSPLLGRYFQAVMWLGRTDLRLAGGPFHDADCTDPHTAPVRELGTAVALHQLLIQAGQVERWRQFDKIIQTFVGWTDSATFDHLGELLIAAKISSLRDLPDATALLGLQEQIAQGNIGVQNIRSDYFISPLGREQIVFPRSFTVFGQKFVPDSWALAQCVYDSIIWDEDGKPGPEDKVARRVPSALDVAFTTLANNQAVPNLVARLNDLSPARHPFRDGLNYQHNLAAVRNVLDAQAPSAWTGTLYMDWLGVLRELSAPLTSPKLPQTFHTRAWAMKSLNTQLASWSQLRHDTILYAKQSYAGVDLCAFPAVLVEPHPTFWGRMLAMVNRAQQALANLPSEGAVKFAYRPLWDFQQWEDLVQRNPETNCSSISKRWVKSTWKNCVRGSWTTCSYSLRRSTAWQVWPPFRPKAESSLTNRGWKISSAI